MPVFADVDRVSGLLDPKKIEAKGGDGTERALGEARRAAAHQRGKKR